MKLNAYNGIGDDIATTGFSQKGYNSILRYDTWRSQYTGDTETARFERVGSICASFGSIDVTDLKVFVDNLIAENVEYCNVEVEQDYDVTTTTLIGNKRIIYKKTKEQFEREYNNYVRDVDISNIRKWDKQAREDKIERDERAEYRRLQAKYGKV